MQKIDYDNFEVVLKNAERWSVLKEFFIWHDYKNCVRFFEKYKNKIVCEKCKMALVESTLTSAIWIDLSDFNYYKHDSTDDSSL